jgi:hypothetical protein
VDGHHPDPHQIQKDDIAHHGAAEGIGDHRVSAVFHHNGLAGKFLNIGQGLDQGLGLLFMRGHMNHVFSLI